MSRVLLCLVTLGSGVAAQSSSANPPDFRLQVVPAMVFKVDDPGNSRTSSFAFEIAVICSTDCELTPISAIVELSSGGVAVERQQWTAAMLARIQDVRHRILPNTPAWSAVRLFTLPEAFDLRLYFRRPQALAIDSAVVRITVADANGRRAEQSLAIPIRYYQQKTTLIFPFRGRGIVGQDWITNGGHGGYWNQFALDVGGLDQNFAAITNDSRENASDAGWGREILASAAGTVTYARNDIPDNPRPDTITYMAQHDPIMAFMGNCVIIDHGNSEYSVLMHLQQGSVTVRVGERVAAGQVVGRLGNSGDSFGPHLHYQLQAGPQVFRDQSLPFRFQNIDTPLSRGRTFSDALPLRYKPVANRLPIGIGDLAAIQVAPPFGYVGGQRFILGGSADAEQHLFVVADSSKTVQRLYWIQIESLLPTRPGAYNYAADSTTRIQNFALAVNRRVYTTGPAPLSDRARAFGFVEAAGFRIPAGGSRVRFVYLPDEPARREVMIIYWEPGAGAERAAAGIVLERRP